MTKPLAARTLAIAILAFAGALGSCSGGSDDGGPPPPPPVANAVADAGPAQEVSRGAAITLDGRASTDPDGDALTYAWTQVHGPDVTGGLPLTGAQPALNAPEIVCTLVFELRVDPVAEISLVATSMAAR